MEVYLLHFPFISQVGWCCQVEPREPRKSLGKNASISNKTTFFCSQLDYEDFQRAVQEVSCHSQGGWNKVKKTPHLFCMKLMYVCVFSLMNTVSSQFSSQEKKIEKRAIKLKSIEKNDLHCPRRSCLKMKSEVR